VAGTDGYVNGIRTDYKTEDGADESHFKLAESGAIA
jgi:hypothetical protein